jgi:hypothetical protein
VHPPLPHGQKGEPPAGAGKSVCGVLQRAQKKEIVKRALAEKESVMGALPEWEALFFVDMLIEGLRTHEVSETARACALNGAEGRSPRTLTLQKRWGGQFHSHDGESFWGLHSNKSHRMI